MLKKFIPFFSWIGSYNKKSFLGDLPAGLTVGIMLIPQGMAYAMIAGLPPVFGLYASLIPQVIYAFLGTSRQLAVGPVAMDSLLVAAGLSVIAEIGSESYILLAITLAFMMGAIQLLMGIFRLGFLVNFLSKPVISGFTSAAALVIGLSQLKHLIGVDLERSNQIHMLVYNALQRLDEVNLITLAIGIGGIVVIKLMKKHLPKWPAALIVVVLGIGVVSLLDLGAAVAIVGVIPDGFPQFALPSFDLETYSQLGSVSLTLALIAFMEAISVAKAVEQKHDDYKVDANQELIAIGTSNIIGSFFQSYPTTGGFSRTAVNDQAGAKTGIAAIISAVVVAMTLLFLTPLFHNLPNAVLASIIMVAVFGLIDFEYPVRLFKNRKEEFFLLMFTFVVTLIVGIKEGILFGVALSLILLIYRTTKPHYAVLGNVEGTDLYKNVKRFPKVLQREDTLIVRFDSQLYFANSEYFKSQILAEISKRGNALKHLVLSMEGVSFVDSSANQLLLSLVDDVKAGGVQVSISNATGPVRDIFQFGGLTSKIQKQYFFNTVAEAIAKYDGALKEKDFERLNAYANQSSLNT